MPAPANSNDVLKNYLLAVLPDDEFVRVKSKLESVSFKLGEVLYESGDKMDHVYFPTTAIISLLYIMENGATAEIGIVGNEGFIGLPVFLGVETSNTHALVQGAGVAMQMKTADFLAECKNGGALPRILQRHTHSLMTQISQSAACNRFHDIEARLARWLLMTGDRMMSDEFQITQDFLSNMLGVRREAVNKSATVFQQNELIRYSRGKISILNRAGLEAAACRCYFIIKEEYENVSG